MGPPSDNGGYATSAARNVGYFSTSMGPPSDNGGYAIPRWNR